jgi:alcohol dehydrogenase class IV
MVKFIFSTAGKIVFGQGTINQLDTHASNLGTNVLVVVGKRKSSIKLIQNALNRTALRLHFYHVFEEPTIDIIQNGLNFARENRVDLVIGLGGGSVIDAAKAIAALATNPGDVIDYLEVIGKNQPIIHRPLPIIAVPTTSGTGTEATRNAVIGSKEHRRKVSIRHRLLLPDIAIVDSKLAKTMPPHVTASSGMDALTQLIEPYVTADYTPITDALCRDGIQLIRNAIINAFNDGRDMSARNQMALASLYGGIALTNANLGAVHGIAGPFGGMFDAPHGAVCGRLLPSVMAVNIKAIQNREPHNPALSRYTDIARWMTGLERVQAMDGAYKVSEIVDKIGVPGLGSYGFTEDDLDDLINHSYASSSMKGNPIQLQPADIREILMGSI